MTATFSAPLVLYDPTNPAAAQPYHGLHAVSPILLGFATPFLVVLTLAPKAFVGLGEVAFGLLILTVLTSTVIFIHGVFNRGQVAAIAVDPKRRAVDIIETGTFSRSITTLSFDRIAEYRTITTYDREGGQYPRSQIVMRTGEQILLPIVPSPAELSAIRAILGR